MNAATWQDKIFETPTVLLSGHVSGEEEVPVGVQALLLLVSLSHLLSYQLQSSCLISNLGYLWSTCHRQCWYEMLSQHQIFSAIVQCEHETLGCFWHAFGIVSTKFGLQCFANAFTVLPTFNDTMIQWYVLQVLGQVLLASCYDSDLTKKIESDLLGQWVEAQVHDLSQDGHMDIQTLRKTCSPWIRAFLGELQWHHPQRCLMHVHIGIYIRI